MTKNYDFTTLVDRTQDSSNKYMMMNEWKQDTKPDTVPFSVADADIKTCPEIVKGLQEYIGQTVLGYTRVSDSYKEATINWNKNRHAWDVDAEWIVTSPGVVPAFYTAINSFTQPGDGVLILSPVYYPFSDSIIASGRTLHESHLINNFPRFEIDFKDLEEKLAQDEVKLMFLCNPHNPVGRVWTKEELTKISELTLKHNVIVLSDEIHYDIIAPGYKQTVFATISEATSQNCIVCTAPSKSFNIAGLQASGIIIPNKELREKFVHTQELNGFHGINMVGMKATEIAYTQGDAWLEGFLNLLWTNKKVLEDFIATEMPELKMYELEGTYLPWIDFSCYGLTSEELEKTLHEAEIFFDEGYIFGKGGDQFERINMACPTHILEKMLQDLKQTLHHLAK